MLRTPELILLWSLLTLPLFADDLAVYQGADSVAKTRIALIDQMVAERKYESAYQVVSQEEQNPFLVAKRVELATNYFVQSINHKVFAFKDLAPGESLDSLRAGQGSFRLYSFDPEATIQRLLNAGVRPPILYKALGDLGLALSQGDLAIDKYALDPQYRMDALLLCADAAFFGEKYDLSLGYLDRALNISREDYRVYRKLGKVYLGQGNIERANESLDRLFAFAPTNPSVTQMASEAYLGVNNLTALLAFYTRNIAKYQNLPEAQGNLYFHLGLQYETDGKPQDSLLAAKKAKEAFSQANKYDDQIKAAVDALISRVS